MLIDSHCHLDFPDLNNHLNDLLSAMESSNVIAALCIGVNLEEWDRVFALAKNYRHLFASVGIHPEYKDAQETNITELSQLADHPKVIAIGETGLDYYWHKLTDSPTGVLDWQLDRFRMHIQTARKINKPLIIHTRDSIGDTLRLLKEECAETVGGIMHCFTEDWQSARQALDMNFYISFSGIVSFKNAHQVHHCARKVPADRLLIETDAPFLAPVPFRGKTNQPAYVKYVAAALAELRNTSIEKIAEQTTENFFTLFPNCRSIL